MSKILQLSPSHLLYKFYIQFHSCTKYDYWKESLLAYNQNHINMTNHISSLTYWKSNYFYFQPLNKMAYLEFFH